MVMMAPPILIQRSRGCFPWVERVTVNSRSSRTPLYLADILKLFGFRMGMGMGTGKAKRKEVSERSELAF